MRYRKYGGMLLLALASTIVPMFAQDDGAEKQKLPPEKIWAEFMETKPEKEEIIKLLPELQKPYKTFGAAELALKELSEKELVSIMLAHPPEPYAALFWERLRPVSTLEALVKIQNCGTKDAEGYHDRAIEELLKRDLPLDILGDLACYPAQQEPNASIWNKFFGKSPGKENFMNLIDSGCRKLAIQELLKEALDNEELVTLLYPARFVGEIENVAARLLSQNPRVYELQAIVDMTPDPYRTIASEMLKQQGVTRKNELLNIMRREQ